MTIATVPLRWLRPGVYRWGGPVRLMGGAAGVRYTSTIYREPDGGTCIIVRRQSLLARLRRRWFS